MTADSCAGYIKNSHKSLPPKEDPQTADEHIKRC